MRKKKEEYECLIRQLSQKLDAGSSPKDEEDIENVVDGLVARRSSASAAESPASPSHVLQKTNTMPLVSRESPVTHVHRQSSASPSSSKQQTLQTPDQVRLQPFVPSVHSSSPSGCQQQQHDQHHQQEDQHHQQVDQHHQQQDQQRQHHNQQQQQQDEYQPTNPYLYRRPTLQRGDRPPRLRPFSLKRLIRKLWGTDPTSRDHQNLDNPLPDKMEAIRTIRRITSSTSSTSTSTPVMERRMRSRSGGEARGNPPVRSGSLRKKEGPPVQKFGKGSDVDQVVLLKSHKRRNSDTVQGMEVGVAVGVAGVG